MTVKPLKQVIDELERLAEAKKINLEIYDKLMSKLQNEDYFYTDEENEECMSELHSLVSKKLLEKDTMKSVEYILDENEEKHANETSFIIKTIVSKSKEERKSSAKLKSVKKAFWITFFLGIFGWIYCFYHGNEKCKKVSNYVFISQKAFAILVVAIVVPIVVLK